MSHNHDGSFDAHPQVSPFVHGKGGVYCNCPFEIRISLFTAKPNNWCIRLSHEKKAKYCDHTTDPDYNIKNIQYTD